MWYSVTASGAPMYGWIAGLSLLGCDEDVASRITLTLDEDPPTWRMDLNPLTVADGVDNTIVVNVRFEELGAELERELEWQAYRVQYGLGDQFSPILAEAISIPQIEGTTAQLVLRGADQDQLDWVFDRYTGGELLVPFRVGLFGVLTETVGVEIFEEFTASFADYGSTGAPTGN